MKVIYVNPDGHYHNKKSCENKMDIDRKSIKEGKMNEMYRKRMKGKFGN